MLAPEPFLSSFTKRDGIEFTMRLGWSASDMSAEILLKSRPRLHAVDLLSGASLPACVGSVPASLTENSMRGNSFKLSYKPPSRRQAQAQLQFVYSLGTEGRHRAHSVGKGHHAHTTFTVENRCCSLVGLGHALGSPLRKSRANTRSTHGSKPIVSSKTKRVRVTATGPATIVPLPEGRLARARENDFDLSL